MVVGMLTLAVPGSANFAGEFSILAGVFAQGWGYAAVGAVAIVLAAMYTLRLISGVLHRARGTAVRPESLDLRLGELALVVPLVAILLALSVWPAAISERSFPGDPPSQAGSRRRPSDRRRDDRDSGASTGSRSLRRSPCSARPLSVFSVPCSFPPAARRVFSARIRRAAASSWPVSSPLSSSIAALSSNC